MKNIILLLAGAFGILNAQAQYATGASSILTANAKRMPFINTTVSPDNQPKTHHSTAKTTTVVTIATETFGTGSPTSLPTGWTAGVISGTGTWHWADVASTAPYSLGIMNSTTSGDGWMIFDSDSLGTACSCAPGGWLQSPAYYCDTDTSVCLNFEDYFGKLNDSCFVWVSTDPTFATYTSYPVPNNNNLANNVITANPVTVHINISAVAALQPAVYIRFVYYDNAGQTGGYSWMIDDMSLTRMVQHDLGISGAFAYEPDATAYNGSVFYTPLVFVDSVFPVAYISNFGASAATHDTIINTVSVGTFLLDTLIYDSLPVNAYDSLIRFPGFLPAGTGVFSCSIGTKIDSFAYPANNTATISFTVTDTLWQENVGPPTEIYTLYSNYGGAPVSYMQGTRFDVPDSSAGDTVSGFGVVFAPASVPTNPGATVSVQLYSTQKGDSGWAYVGTSVARAIQLADISTPYIFTWADFRIDPASSGGIIPFILHPGTTYAAMVQTNGVANELFVDGTPAPGCTGPFCGYFGQFDTSFDDGANSFSPHSVATGNPIGVPFVRMYFGNIPLADVTAVKNINTAVNHVGIAYPDPANASVNIPFDMARDVPVTVTLYNVLGQVINVKNMQATGGESMKATFATDDLPGGVYLYSVAANGELTNGRVIVAH